MKWVVIAISAVVCVVSCGLVYLLRRGPRKSQRKKIGLMRNAGIQSRRTVGFFDVLGFKRKVAETPLDQLAAKYDQIMIRTTEAMNRPFPKNHGAPRLFPNHPDAEPWCIQYVFSDTIILISGGENEDSCLKLLVYAWRLTQLLIAADMPPRGAITFGEVYVNPDNNIVLGRALTDAYELERTEDWIGVAIHKSLEDAFPALFQCFRDSTNILSHLFRRYPVPLKDGSRRNLHTLNWRWNMVVKKGTRSLFARQGHTAIMEKVNNTLDYAKTVVDPKQVYASGPGVPIELRTFYVSDSPPGDHPFPHGDDL